MVNRSGVLTCLLAVSAGSAAAACPDASAMEGEGVWIETSDGGLWHMQRGEGNVIVETSYYPGDDVYRTESYHGLYFSRDGAVKDGKLDPATITRYEYPDAGALPHPDSRGSWSDEVKVFFPDEQEPSVERFAVNRGVVVDFAIGDCTYPGRIILATLTDPDGASWTTQYNYIASLGIAVFLAGGENPLAYEFRYDPISISGTRP